MEVLFGGLDETESFEGLVRTYGVDSTNYWIRSSPETVVISREKERILNLLKVPRGLNELTRALNRDHHSVSLRLHELEKLGLIARANSKWGRVFTSRRVTVK